MRYGRPDVFDYATIVRCAAETADKGKGTSETHLLEVMSYANDCVRRIERPDLWERVDLIATEIARLTSDWDDETKVPLNLDFNSNKT